MVQMRSLSAEFTVITTRLTVASQSWARPWVRTWRAAWAGGRKPYRCGTTRSSCGGMARTRTSTWALTAGRTWPTSHRYELSPQFTQVRIVPSIYTGTNCPLNFTQVPIVPSIYTGTNCPLNLHRYQLSPHFTQVPIVPLIYTGTNCPLNFTQVPIVPSIYTGTNCPLNLHRYQIVP